MPASCRTVRPPASRCLPSGVAAAAGPQATTHLEAGDGGGGPLEALGDAVDEHHALGAAVEGAVRGQDAHCAAAHAHAAQLLAPCQRRRPGAPTSRSASDNARRALTGSGAPDGDVGHVGARLAHHVGVPRRGQHVRQQHHLCGAAHIHRQAVRAWLQPRDGPSDAKPGLRSGDACSGLGWRLTCLAADPSCMTRAMARSGNARCAGTHGAAAHLLVRHARRHLEAVQVRCALLGHRGREQTSACA